MAALSAGRLTVNVQHTCCTRALIHFSLLKRNMTKYELSYLDAVWFYSVATTVSLSLIMHSGYNCRLPFMIVLCCHLLLQLLPGKCVSETKQTKSQKIEFLKQVLSFSVWLPKLEASPSKCHFVKMESFIIYDLILSLHRNLFYPVQLIRLIFRLY